MLPMFASSSTDSDSYILLMTESPRLETAGKGVQTMRRWWGKEPPLLGKDGEPMGSGSNSDCLACSCHARPFLGHRKGAQLPGPIRSRTELKKKGKCPLVWLSS